MCSVMDFRLEISQKNMQLFTSVVDMRQLTYFSKEGVVGKGDVTLTKEGLFP